MIRIEFDNTPYLQAVQKKSITLKDPISIQKFAFEHPQFNYGNVNYKEYSNHYTEVNWKSRKIKALPLLLKALIKTIAQIFRFIFYGFPAGFIGKKKIFLKEIFTLIRYTEETLGYFLMIFNDRLGCYMTEQADFHNNCNSCFNNPIADPAFASVPHKIVYGVSIPNYEEAKEMSLWKLKELDKKEQQNMVKYFHLEDDIKKVENEFEFFPKLNEIDPCSLKALTILDLKLPSGFTNIRFGLLTKKELEELELNQLEHASPEQLTFLRKRLRWNTPLQTSSFKLTLNSLENILSTPLYQIQNIKGSKINQWIDRIPPVFFSILSDKQLKKIDVSALSLSQIQYLFPEEDEDQIDRFHLFSVHQINTLITNIPRKLYFLLQKLTDKHLKGISISLLKDHIFDAVFSSRNNSSENKRKLGLLPFNSSYANEIEEFLNQLRGEQVTWLSSEQIAHIPLKWLTQNFSQFFSSRFSPNTNAQRFSYIQFKNYLPEDIAEFLSSIEGEQWHQLSKSQLKYVPNELLLKNFENIFSSRYSFEENNQRFQSLKTKQQKALKTSLKGEQKKFYLNRINNVENLDNSENTDNEDNSISTDNIGNAEVGSDNLEDPLSEEPILASA